MPAWQSIRFRLSVQYSALVFGLGGGLLGLVYLAIQRWLQSQTMMATIVTGQRVWLLDGTGVVLPELRPVEIRAIESIYNEIVLDRVAQFTLFAIGALFLLSLVVGWVMSGRVLKPVGEITRVAREIQASDLSRRIDLSGPDDEIKQLGDTFDQMLERLEQAFASQRQFLADTSHDLRTPLTVIRSNVELVSGDPRSRLEDWREAGEVIRRNAEKMSEMIQGLLASARLQTGSTTPEEVDLARLVSAKVADFSTLAAQREVSIVGEGESVEVSGVRVALDRALTNLIDNAVRVAPSGSVVRVASGSEDGWAFLAVGDEGPGLPDESDRIGLGLTIVERIVEGHGGVLQPISETGGGTTMVIRLPIGSPNADPPVSSPFTRL